MPAQFVPYTAIALWIVHFALAAGVTLHVLAHNRNPGSAVSWIGLAWLSPVVGSLLYVLLGINRVRRRARRLIVAGPDDAVEASPGPQGCEHLAGLELAARRISRRNVQSGNAVTMLANGDAAYPQMMAAIETATASIALSSYIFRADQVGTEFIAALSSARRRGAEVRVLIDGYGSGYLRSASYRKLRHARVPAARFMHSVLPWR